MQQAEASVDGAPRTGRRGWRRLCYLGATAIVAVSTAVSLSQGWSPDPLRPPRRFSAGWWLAPIEVNAAGRLPSVDADLLDVTADPTGTHVIAVGRRGTIVHSDDGGLTWKVERARGPRAAPGRETAQPNSYDGVAPAGARDVQPNPPRRQKPAPDAGAPPRTDPKRPEEGAKGARLHPFRWLVGRAHAAEVAQAPPPASEPGDRGAQATPDEASADEGSAPNLERDVLAVAIRDWPDDVVALVSGPGLIWLRGERWIPVGRWPSDPPQVLVSARISRSSAGILASGSLVGLMLPPLRAPNLSVLGGALAANFPGARAVGGSKGEIVVVAGDSVYRLSDRKWIRVRQTTGAQLRGAYYRDDQYVWAIGEGGEILRASDGSSTWLPSTTPAPVPLNAVFFLPDNLRGWIVGNDGYLASTTDGGATFTARLAHRTARAKADGTPVRLPPPWYALSWVFALGLFFVGRSIPATKEGQTELAVAPAFASDRPLERGDPDVLNLAAIAGGLSRFLRNEATTPPLTIAVTGKWGTGKSSLMNLLRSDLRSFGFHPVWFNAWHHQKEENLLASLLQAIRMQAIPSWWRIEGLLFRVHLLLIRGRKHALLLLALLAAVGLLLANESAGNTSDKGELAQAWKMVREWVVYLVSPTGKVPESAESFALAKVGTALALAFSVFRGLRAFGLNPGTLLATAAGSIKMRDLDAQTSFREKFRGEYAEVTRALGPRKLIIFIDDLDRCQPKQVMEVLESINFLVTSGDCFVVMGMDRERVEPSVALTFKDVAAELSGKDDPASRREYAIQYLDKLINIEVPVPSLDDADVERMLAPDEPAGEAVALTGWRRWARDTGAGMADLLGPALRFWPLAVGLAALVAGYAGGRLTATEAPAGAPAAVAPAPPAAPGGAAPGAAAGSAGATAGAIKAPETLSEVARALAAEIAARPAQSGRLMAPGGGSFPTAVFLLVLVAGWMLFLLVQMAQLRPETVVRDSSEFTGALRAWRSLIFKSATTPRALKRFQNRVRFLSMRQRRSPETRSWWRTVLDGLLGRAPAPPPAQDVVIPDPILVALAAIYQSHPELLTEAAATRDGLRALVPPPPKDLTDAATLAAAPWNADALASEVDRHRAAFLLRVRGFRVR